MSQKEHRQPPAFIHSALRDHNSLALPSVIRRASGIIIMGRRMKSLIFTTDIAIIRNCNADAVLAVYPFTPQQVIMDAIISASSIPVVCILGILQMCGVGGGVTDGIRSVMLAKDAEAQGAFGVVVNAPMRNQTVETMKKVVDIPIIATVTSENYDIAARLAVLRYSMFPLPSVPPGRCGRSGRSAPMCPSSLPAAPPKNPSCGR